MALISDLQILGVTNNKIRYSCKFYPTYFDINAVPSQGFVGLVSGINCLAHTTSNPNSSIPSQYLAYGQSYQTVLDYNTTVDSGFITFVASMIYTQISYEVLFNYDTGWNDSSVPQYDTWVELIYNNRVCQECYHKYGNANYYIIRTAPESLNNVENLYTLYYPHPYPNNKFGDNHFKFNYNLIDGKYKWKKNEPITSLITNLNEYLLKEKQFMRWINQSEIPENINQFITFSKTDPISGNTYLSHESLNSLYSILGYRYPARKIDGVYYEDNTPFGWQEKVTKAIFDGLEGGFKNRIDEYMGREV